MPMTLVLAMKKPPQRNSLLRRETMYGYVFVLP